MRRQGIPGTTTIAFLALLALAPRAEARQISDKMRSVLDRAKQASDELRINDQQEQELGAAVSERIRARYGVVQDPAVHRYLALVGTVLAQASSRPSLPWKFIVLDTDGVNAFAAPGGYIHVTRGALALVANEAELAGVIAHELIHVTEKHTIRALQKGKLVQMGADQANFGKNSEIFRRLVDTSTDVVLAGFGRAEELEADQKGIRLANQVGYAPPPFRDFLARLADRNKAASGKQGLFASHPEMRERLDRLTQQIAAEKLSSTATLEGRYHVFVSYKPTEQAAIAVVEEGAAGLTGAKSQPKTADPKPKKKGFGLSDLLAPSSGGTKKSAEVTGSAAARGVDKELGARGGAVKTMVAVGVTAQDIAAFKREGHLK
ncbi:MAG: M48 family metalloprotease [Bacteroidales bacterium]